MRAGGESPARFASCALPGLFEGVTDRQPAIDDLAVLKVFGVEDYAASFEGRGGDQGVVDSVVGFLRELKRRFVRMDRDGDRRIAERSERIQRFFDFLPGHVQFAAGDGDELIEDLHAERAPGAKQLLGHDTAGIVLRQGVD